MNQVPTLLFLCVPAFLPSGSPSPPHRHSLAVACEPVFEPCPLFLQVQVPLAFAVAEPSRLGATMDSLSRAPARVP